MGHIRLGTLPETKPWWKVVGHIAEGDSAAVVAGATSQAAVNGLNLAKADRGVAQAVYLLAKTVLASRLPDFSHSLRVIGLNVPADPSLFDLTSRFTEAMRAWRANSQTRRSDVSSMMDLAVVESLTRCLGKKIPSLFEGNFSLQRGLKSYSTRKGFATLAHEVFSRFTRRFLLYHLGRELPLHVGGNGRFHDRFGHTAFVTDLDTHCREAAVIVHDFAGDWYSKTKFETGITARQAAGFTAHCLDKLADELHRRGMAHVA